MRGLWARAVRAVGGDVYPGDGAARIDVGSFVAGVGIRDFSAQWVTPAPASSFAVPKGCSNAETEAEADGAWGSMVYGDR